MKEIGDQLVALSTEQAEELRSYIMEEYGLVMGHIESVVSEKTKNMRRSNDSGWSKEFCYWIFTYGSPHAG